MANIQAFRGLRYDLGKVGSLSDVVAPPYDVIDSDFQNNLYDRHPNNVVRLILNQGDANGQPGDERYEQAAKTLKSWRRDAVLVQDNLAAIYVYHQIFEHEGVSITRRGFLCRCGLEPFGTGNIYPHEQTHAGPKKDRLKLTQACKANLSPIFSVYPDDTNEAQEILEQGLSDRTPTTAEDHLGVVHKIWMVTDPQVIARAAAAMGDKPLYVADGHHRYETACNYQQFLRDEQQIDETHPANSVLMTCVSTSDPGMIVLPTHRLFRGLPPIDSKQLQQKINPAFSTEIVGSGAELAPSIWERIEFDDEQSQMGLYCGADDTWVLATLTEAGESMLAQIQPDRSEDWRSLGVSILHELLVGNLLDGSELPTPRYVRSVEEVVDGIKNGDSAGRDATGQTGSGGQFELAAIVMPATLAHIEAISRHGERMPAKSTYFYPKLLTGLVINPLE